MDRLASMRVFQKVIDEGGFAVVGLLGYEVTRLVDFERRRRSAPVDARGPSSNDQPRSVATPGIRCPCTWNEPTPWAYR